VYQLVEKKNLDNFLLMVTYPNLDGVEHVNCTEQHYRPTREQHDTVYSAFVSLFLFLSHCSVLCQTLRDNRHCFQRFSFIGILHQNWGQNATFCGWSCTSQNARKQFL